MSFSVSKYSLSAASLVTALPAAFLAYILVMAFLQKPGFNEMKGFFQIISGLTLLMVTLIVLMPVGILIFGKKPNAVPKEDTKKKAEEGEELAVNETAEPKAKPKDDEEDIAVDDGEDVFEDDEFADEGFEDEGFDDDDFDDFDDKKRK